MGENVKQVICIRWGEKYGVDYVNKLYRMVAANITPPFRFYCVTDNGAGLDDGIDVIDLPELGCAQPTTKKGQWGKSRLWAENLGGLSGPVLFMDLDVVVVGNLDGFFEHGDADKVYLTRNPNTPFERLGQTSLFRYPIGGLKKVREEFMAAPQETAETFVFEQRFVTRRTPGGVIFWPKGWVCTYKWHCTRTFPMNFFLPPKLPKDAKVVIFPGSLNPPDAIAGRWNPETKVLSRWEHIKAGLRGERQGSLFRHLRHFILPSDWVRKHWTPDTDQDS